MWEFSRFSSSFSWSVISEDWWRIHCHGDSFVCYVVSVVNNNFWLTFITLNFRCSCVFFWRAILSFSGGSILAVTLSWAAQFFYWLKNRHPLLSGCVSCCSFILRPMFRPEYFLDLLKDEWKQRSSSSAWRESPSDYMVFKPIISPERGLSPYSPNDDRDLCSPGILTE